MTEAKREEKEENEVVQKDDTLVWIGLGAVAVAAVAATIYVVQQNRNTELNAMRYRAPPSESKVKNILLSARDGFSSFWESTSETFGKVNTFVRKVLTSTEDATSLFPEVVEPINIDNDEEAVSGEEMI